MTLRYSTPYVTDPRPEYGQRVGLSGLWRQIAESIDAGAVTMGDLVRLLRDPGESHKPARDRLKGAAGMMIKTGLLRRTGSDYAMTERARDQLNTLTEA